MSRILYIGILVCFGLQAKGQNTSDVSWRYQHWQWIGLNYEVSNKFHVQSTLSSRFHVEPSEINKLFVEIEPSYELTDWLNVAVGYRFNSDLENNWNRFYAQLEPEIDLGKDGRIMGRLLYTREKERFRVEQFYRIRLKPRYKWGKSRLAVSSEGFVNEDFELDKWRHGLWYNYEIRKNHTIKTRLILDARKGRRTGIIGVGYTFDL